MKHWEFLLQKEGDRSWLPLEAPTVEILEGRYRIVVRASRRDATVEMRICHLDTAADPPKRRIQKRTSRTNVNGLMVLIPFTRLQPGIWELQCSLSDLMTELVEGGSQSAVQLHVLASESEADPWEPDEFKPGINSSSATPCEPIAADIAAATDASCLEAIDPAATEILAVTLDPIAAASPTLPEPIAAPGLEAVVEACESIPRMESPANHPPETTDFGAEIAQLLHSSPQEATQAHWFHLTEQLSEQLMHEVLGDLDLLAVAEPIGQSEFAAPHHPVAPTVSGSWSEIPAPLPVSIPSSCALQLEQSTLVALPAETLQLSGRAELSGEAIEAELHLYLRDPQSMQVLVSDRQSLPPATGDFPFCFTFQLPTQLTTRLIVGEVVLARQADAQATDAIVALGSQPFTVTVNPAELVQKLTRLHPDLEPNQMDDRAFFLTADAAAKQTDSSLELSFLNLVSTTHLAPPPQQPDSLSLHLSFLPPTNTSDPDRRIAPPRFESLAGKPLPPQLYQPDPTQAKQKSVKLPAFGMPTAAIEQTVPVLKTPESPPEPSLNSTATSTTAVPLESVAIEPPVPPEAPVGEPPDLPQSDDPVPTAEAASQLASDAAPSAESATPSIVPEQATPTPEQIAFQALKLQERFLNRLSSLAADAELPALLRGEQPQATNLVPTKHETVPSQILDADRLDYEIVVEDEPSSYQSARWRNPKSADDLDSTLDRSSPLLLSADQSVPRPDLQITPGELTAGQPVNVRVRLPDLLPRIFVKLWVTDRQTRSLLDGPRWLVDFLPNGFGELEAFTQLSVPFGSLEIRFEAIAIEMHTQRESHKASVDRGVVPPDLPVMSLDEFQV